MTTSLPEHPPADPSKLISHLDDWQKGEELPGRTLSYLKTAMLPDVFESVDDETATTLRSIWEPWERGKATPADVMTALDEAGLRTFLESVEGS